MAKVKLAAGADIELLTQGELRQELGAHSAAMRAPYQAVSVIRLPLVFGAKVGASLSMGGDVPPLQTPQNGYVWALRHLVIEGLATGATPDVVNILRENRIVWQLNGNTFFAVFSRGAIMLNEGETLAYQSVGTFNATGQIIAHGTAWQMPAQFVAELGL